MKINRCQVCGNIELEKITWKTKTWKFTKLAFLTFLLLTSLIGTTGLYNFIQTRVFDEPNLIFQIGQFYAFSNNFASNFQSNSKTTKLKEIANNLTKDCESVDESCKAKKIYNELSNFNYLYENATNLDPINTWDNREGDCDMMSYLLISLLKQENIPALLSCNMNHCWVVIHLENPKKIIIADLTGERGWEER